MDLKYIAFLVVMLGIFYFAPADMRQFLIFFVVVAIFINQIIHHEKK